MTCRSSLGFRTKVPSPTTRSITSSPTRASIAWRTVIRARPNRSARSRSEGSAEPGGQALDNVGPDDFPQLDIDGRTVLPVDLAGHACVRQMAGHCARLPRMSHTLKVNATAGTGLDHRGVAVPRPEPRAGPALALGHAAGHPAPAESTRERQGSPVASSERNCPGRHRPARPARGAVCPGSHETGLPVTISKDGRPGVDARSCSKS